MNYDDYTDYLKDQQDRAEKRENELQPTTDPDSAVLAMLLYGLRPRKIAKDIVNGIFISTIEPIDFNGFETAIANIKLPDWHPVERYLTEDQAIAGHARWIEWAKEGPREVIDIGIPGYMPEKIVDLRNE